MILCADDFGLSQDIDRAILDLCRLDRLTAVSCMVALERCNSELLRELMAFEKKVDIGLHLCLTDENLPLSRTQAHNAAPFSPFPSFAVLLRRSLQGKVRPSEVTLEVARQYELFVEKTERKPAFIDGHLHVHQLRGAREGVMEFVLGLPAASRPYIRNTRMPVRQLRGGGLPWLKTSLIGAFGDRMFKQLRQAGLATNEGFAGIYDFKAWRDYPDYLPRFTDSLNETNGMLVVHPGQKDEWRRQEFAALRDFPFPQGSLNNFRR
jgi:hypothetical protein